MKREPIHISGAANDRERRSLSRAQSQPPMTEAQARAYAAGDRHYVARPDRVGDGWHVWDSVSDHRVEFQENSNG